MGMNVWVNVCLYDTVLTVEVVRKAIVARRSWSICWNHLQTFSVSTVLGQKASDVEQSWGASAKFPESRPPPHWTGRVLQKGHMFSELRVLLFCSLGVCMGGWERMCEWMSLECHSCAQTPDRGERCLGPDLQCPRKRHQAPRVRVTRSQPGELLKPGRKGLLWRLLDRHCCRTMLEYLLNTSTNVFCQ